MMRRNKVETAVQCSVCHAQVFAGLSGDGNSIYNIVPLLKKENVHLYVCPWAYNDYAYFQTSRENVVLELTLSSVKS